MKNCKRNKIDKGLGDKADQLMKKKTVCLRVIIKNKISVNKSLIKQILN